jgi:hypothetical protein
MSDITIIGDSNDIFVVVGSVKIAKRGHEVVRLFGQFFRFDEWNLCRG